MSSHHPRGRGGRRGRRIGLALGSGAARGWSHIGVIQALEERGVTPDVVCGTSIGALVGGAYAAGDLEDLDQWVRGLEWHDVVRLLDVSLEGGLIEGRRLFHVLQGHLASTAIEDLPKAFAAVATNLYTGQEVWFRDGNLLDAVRASIALPGLFTPTVQEGEILVDGGLVNPVPVSLCRAMGAQLVIAVDLNAGLLGRHLQDREQEARHIAELSAGEVADESTKGFMQAILDGAMRIKDWVGTDEAEKLPTILEIMASSINIMQVRITRSRMAGDPADAVLTPRVSHLGLMEFHKAAEAIEAGRKAVERLWPELKYLLEHT